MKVCPYCKAENEDKYIYCVECHRELPKRSHLENLWSLGTHAMDNKNYRDALKYFNEILKLNIGNREAWILKGLAADYLHLDREARVSYNSGEVKYIATTCPHCGGIKRCRECGETGVCYMCKGTRRCLMCRGTGECFSCAGDRYCNVCGGTYVCVRCKGTKECVYCKGTGLCADCKGSGKCHLCDGSGKSLKVDLSTVPEGLRKYFDDKMKDYG